MIKRSLIMITKQTGITLIELMIVVAIVGILAAIAYPSYQEQALEGRRSEGRTALLEVAQAQERFYTANGSYATGIDNSDGDDDSSNDVSGVSRTTENGYYTLSINNGAGSTFTATATPTGTDTDCTSITLNNLGVKGGTGADTSKCW
jgi:type IV pilus assembly protein PilE